MKYSMTRMVGKNGSDSPENEKPAALADFDVGQLETFILPIANVAPSFHRDFMKNPLG
jgi:hypothetical protein